MSIKRYSIPISECNSEESLEIFNASLKIKIACLWLSLFENIFAFCMYSSSLLGSILKRLFNNFSAWFNLSSNINISTLNNLRFNELGCWSKPSLIAFFARAIFPISR